MFCGFDLSIGELLAMSINHDLFPVSCDTPRYLKYMVFDEITSGKSSCSALKGGEQNPAQTGSKRLIVITKEGFTLLSSV